MCMCMCCVVYVYVYVYVLCMCCVYVYEQSSRDAETSAGSWLHDLMATFWQRLFSSCCKSENRYPFVPY